MGNSDTAASAEDQQLQSLLDYCKDQGLIISRAIHPEFSPTSGLGLHATANIRRGQRLIYAPTASLLTKLSIPSTFLPNKRTRTELTLHGLLASWLAFGDRSEVETRYGPWMNTWPGWVTFRDGMPVFWGLIELNPALHAVGSSSKTKSARQRSPRKRRKISSDHEYDDYETKASSTNHSVTSRKFTLSPAVEGHFTSLSRTASTTDTTGTGLLEQQAVKIRHILQVLHDQASVLGFDILATASHDLYIRFLHMWACVNTRCFYYIPQGHTAPDDPNEAMALAPFQDLFNHSASATQSDGCKVRYDAKGFWVYADRDYRAGDELFIKYGRHDNDALWVEYGFMLDENNMDDHLKIDDIVLADLTRAQSELLEAHGYHGDYLLKDDGVCWRTEMAAWLTSGVLKEREWQEMSAGTLDPEQKWRTRYPQMRAKVVSCLLNWLSKIRLECDANITELIQMESVLDKTIATFVPSTAFLEEGLKSSPRKLADLANGRLSLCQRRWKGIHQICTNAAQRMLKECKTASCSELDRGTNPTSFLSYEEFIATIRNGGNVRN